MMERKAKTKFLLPVLIALVLVVILVSGSLYLRSSLMKLTMEERSSQLEEMVAQIRANLSNGLQTHWNLVEGLNNAIQNRHYRDVEALCRSIEDMEEVFCTEMYGSQIMLLDEQGTAYLRSGSVGIWNDVNHVIDGDTRHTFISETDNIDGSFLVFSRELDNPVSVGKDNLRFTHVLLLKDIKTVKQYYTTSTYGGNAATFFIKNNGILTYFDAVEDDVIGARNIFKALREAEYIQENRNFGSVKDEMEVEGIASANIRLDNTEYFYCLASFEDYNMILMLLIPASYVATSTLSMMNSTLRTSLFFMIVILMMLFFAFVSFVRVKRSRQMVELEQKTNRELNQLRLVAEKANAAKSTFLNNMSHDIRTPMNAIIGFTNIALKHNTSPEVTSCLNKIRSSSDHLLALINDVLDISRIESGKIRYTPSPVDIVEVSESVLTIVYGYLANRNINFKSEIDEPPTPFVLADPVRIRDVLVNILGNAVKFTQDGGSITYRVTYQMMDDYRHMRAHFEVRDTGIGMSEDFIDHIFDEFSQESQDARTKYKGTGLGMAITKKYVELMGGTISVESRKGKGSTFTVEIPMEIRKQDESEKMELTPRDVDLKGLKILLAEDNELNAEIAIVQLEELGMDITWVKDGKEALDMFSSKPQGSFDLILMDVMMPNMNGYEATRAIRGLDGRGDALKIPIFAMTANAFAEDVQASLESGMNGHLSKPIVIEDVIKTILRNLDR